MPNCSTSNFRAPDKALACCNRALDIAPGDGDLWYNKGQLLALGFLDFKAALACHEKAIELGAEEAKYELNGDLMIFRVRLGKSKL